MTVTEMPLDAGAPDSAVFWAIGAGTSRVTVLRTYERDGRKRVTVQIEDGPCAGRVVAGVDPGELTGGARVQ